MASEFTRVEGVEVCYERAGPRGEGVTLVFLHGFGASLRTWDDVFPALSQSHDCVRVDLKGFGASEKPDDGAYSPQDQANLVRAFCKDIGLGAIVLVGHSYGGGVALIAALNGLRARLRGLVLLAPAVYRQGFPVMIRAFRWLPGYWAIRGLTTARCRTWATLRYLVFSRRERVTARRVALYARPQEEQGALEAWRAVALAIDPELSAALEPELGTLRVPTLIVWGDDDPVIPTRFAERLASDLWDATLVVLPGVGHVAHEEAPELLLPHVRRFLRRAIG